MKTRSNRNEKTIRDKGNCYYLQSTKLWFETLIWHCLIAVRINFPETCNSTVCVVAFNTDIVVIGDTCWFVAHGKASPCT